MTILDSKFFIVVLFVFLSFRLVDRHDSLVIASLLASFLSLDRRSILSLDRAPKILGSAAHSSHV